ncbi:hypothetical protein [Alienimonas chondri]|uniref:Autotransporter domain-containing protein n=1 Tax=Alienimonas chondri TaxID=2681879 RepID=A0ABX1VFV5_9PLAN|nr:hypothetical protein [Alienimonas chondri]NNJ26722.1 hypothetical protein [Alienimonas chondri]
MDVPPRMRRIVGLRFPGALIAARVADRLRSVRGVRWGAAAALAAASLPSVASGQLTVDSAAFPAGVAPYQVSGTEDYSSAGDFTVESGAGLEVQGPSGHLITDAFFQAGTTDIFSGGLLTVNAGLDFTNSGGTTTVAGTLNSGRNIIVSGGDLIAQVGGTITGAALSQTGFGDFTTAGDVNLSGAATIAGTGAQLSVTGGTFDAASLALSANGDATTNGTVTIAGATTVDSNLSHLTVQGGQFNTGSLALTNAGDATFNGDVNVTGAATLTGAGSQLQVNGGTFDAASLGLSGDAGAYLNGDVNVTGALTVDGTGSLLSQVSGTLDAGSLALTNNGDVAIGAATTLTGNATADGTNSVLNVNSGGSFNAVGLGLTNGGRLQVQGGAAAFSGAATADGASTELRMTSGSFDAASLALSGGATSLFEGGIATITGATTVGGVGSNVDVRSSAQFNAGSLAVNAGQIATAGDVNVTGAATVTGTGVLLDITAGTFDAGSLAVSGLSETNVYGAATIAGALTVSGGVSPISQTEFTLETGGSLTANSLAVTNRGRWTSLRDGNDTDIAGAVTVDGSGSLLIHHRGTFDAATLALTNSGAATFADDATFTGAVSADGTSSQFIVQPGGTFQGASFQATNGGSLTTSSGTATFTGAASFDGAGSQLTLFPVGALNAASLSVTDRATASLFDGSLATITGATTVDSNGAAIDVAAGGSFTGTTLALTDDGRFVTAGTTSFTGDVTLDQSNDDALVGDVGGLHVDGGTMDVGGRFEVGDLSTVEITGDLNVTGAVTSGLAAFLHVNSTGALTAGSGLEILDGTEIRNEGSVVVQSGDVVVHDGDLSAYQSSDFEIVSGDLAVVESSQLGSAGTVTVGGDVRIGGASAEFNSTGRLNAVNLILDADDPLNVPKFSDSSLFDVQGGAVDLSGAAIVRGANSHLDVRLGGTLDAASVTVVDGGTFEVDADSAANVSGDFALTDGLATVFDGGTLTLGSLTQAATGTLDVQSGGTLTVNGAWDAATVTLQDGAVYGGDTTFTGNVIAAGTLAPGNSPGTTTVGGNFNTVATTVLDIEVNPVLAGAAPRPGVDHDQIIVGGTATIDGGTLKVSQFAPGRLSRGTKYDFLVANALVVNDPLTLQNVTGFRFITRFDATTYSLIVGGDAAYAGMGASRNQRAVGGALDALNGAPALAGIFNALDTLPTEAATAAALDGLSGEIYGTHLSATNRSSLAFLDLIGGRDAAFPLHCQTRPAGLGGWWESYGTGGRVNGDANASTAELGTVGTAVGLTQSFVSGGVCVDAEAFYGFESATTRVPGVDSSVTSDLHRVGGSLRVGAGRAFGRVTAFGGTSESESRRAVQIDSPLLPFADRTTGAFDGSLAAADAETGLLFGSPSDYLMPIVGLRYAHTRQDELTEAGGLAALNVDERPLSELRARVGLRAGGVLIASNVLPVSGTMEAVYSRDVSAGTVGDYDARFAAAPGSTFAARGTDFGADRIVLGPGLTIGDGPVRLSTNYRAGLGEDSVLHSGDARLEVLF